MIRVRLFLSAICMLGWRHAWCMAFHPKLSRTFHWVTSNVQKSTCLKCRCTFAVNHDLQVVLPWDDDFEELKNELKDLKDSIENFEKKVEDITDG